MSARVGLCWMRTSEKKADWRKFRRRKPASPEPLPTLLSPPVRLSLSHALQPPKTPASTWERILFRRRINATFMRMQHSGGVRTLPDSRASFLGVKIVHNDDCRRSGAGPFVSFRDQSRFLYSYKRLDTLVPRAKIRPFFCNRPSETGR